MVPESDVRMPLTAHLEELRWRIVRALLAVGVAFAVCYWFAESLFAFLIRPLAALRPGQALIIGTGVTEAFFTKLKVSAIASLIAAMFCYTFVFPVGFRFFLDEYASIEVAPQIRISEYLSFASRMLLAFGV